MKDTWLIQRLRKPPKGKAINPYVFGCGGGKLTKEGREALRTAFEFDYMGSAEFEFGAVPDALDKINAERQAFVIGEIEIPTSKVKIDKWEQDHYRMAKEKKKTVYIWARADHMQYAKDLILSLVVNERSNRLKERSMLRYQFLEEKDGYKDNLGGWLELDNGFFFFIDEKMFKNTLAVFGIEAGKVSK